MKGANDGRGHQDVKPGYATLLPDGGIAGVVGAPGPSNEAAKLGFGPLKVVLSTVYINYKVRLRVASENIHLTIPSTGNRSRQEQDPNPPLTRR